MSKSHINTQARVSLVPSPTPSFSLLAVRARVSCTYLDVDQEILWLDVSVDHLLRVAVLQSISQLCNVLEEIGHNTYYPRFML